MVFGAHSPRVVCGDADHRHCAFLHSASEDTPRAGVCGGDVGRRRHLSLRGGRDPARGLVFVRGSSSSESAQRTPDFSRHDARRRRSGNDTAGDAEPGAIRGGRNELQQRVRAGIVDDPFPFCGVDRRELVAINMGCARIRVRRPSACGAISPPRVRHGGDLCESVVEQGIWVLKGLRRVHDLARFGRLPIGHRRADVPRVAQRWPSHPALRLVHRGRGDRACAAFHPPRPSAVSAGRELPRYA
jgi:hypothetical protein